MYAIDPREFQYEIDSYEIAKSKFDRFSSEDIKNLEIYLSIKNEIRNNEKTHEHNRRRKKVAPIEYENVNNEYWNRGAGYNVEHLKTLKNKLKQEIKDLEGLLIEPDRLLTALYDSLRFFKSTDLDIDFYEHFIENYKKHTEKISFYSIFCLKEGNDEEVFIIVSDSMAELSLFKNYNLLSDQSTLGRSCLSRSVGETFEYTDADSSVRKFMVLSSRLMTKTEIEDLIQKRNRELVVSKEKKATNPFHLHDLYGSNNSRLRKGG
jgi:hypothetical protein